MLRRGIVAVALALMLLNAPAAFAFNPLTLFGLGKTRNTYTKPTVAVNNNGKTAPGYSPGSVGSSIGSKSPKGYNPR
jgi:hypothetical protein